MQAQEIDPVVLAAMPCVETIQKEVRAEDIFAESLTTLPLSTLTKAFVTIVGGRVVGYAGYRRGDGDRDPTRAKVVVWVAPTFRRQGIGARLLRLLEVSARQEEILSLSSYPRLEPDTVQFAKAYGWREVYREVVQAADASQIAADASQIMVMSPPHPIICQFICGSHCTEALTEQFYGVFQGSFPAIAEFWTVPKLYAALQATRPFNGVAFASEGTRVVGIAWGLDAPPDAVYHDFTGVRPEYQGRGISRVLKVTLAQATLSAGRSRLITSNRVGNQGIFVVNRRLGYLPVLEMALFEKEVR